MKGTSKVIMGATVGMVVTLAIVLALVLVLLAELYCSLLLRRRHHPKRASTATAVSNDDPDHPHQPNAPSLCSFYAQGVLRAPRSFLFPAPENLDLEKQPHLPISTIHHSSAPSSSYPWPVQEASPPPSAINSPGTRKEQLIYICNPIYDDEAIRIISKVDTPFETPGTSPSRLETAGCSPSSNKTLSSPSSPPTTPPLTPMKKLPAEGPSVSLRDARSICTTGSDSNSNNDGISSSSSGSPCTSPSW
ncbi:hypothetical protein Pfo_000480 [Paulownia fortunei]|nr:hypothetical protein Pfo_000480 [Paulownia fortunei]